jgi:hypothetical protein
MMKIGLYVQWSEAFGVLVDQQGLMLPGKAIEKLEQLIAQHKQRSPEELQKVGMQTLASFHPNMVKQFNPQYFE